MDELTLLRNLDPDTPGPSPAETAAAWARLLAAIDAAQPGASFSTASASRTAFLERCARPRFWAPLTAAAAVTAVAITAALIAAPGPRTSRPGPAPGPQSAASVLHKAASAAARQPAGHGRFFVNVTEVLPPGGPPALRETWLGDGVPGLVVLVTGSHRGSQRLPVTSEISFGDTYITWAQLQHLPTQPRRLLAYVAKVSAYPGSLTPPVGKEFATIVKALAWLPAPPAVRAALYRAAAKLPGLTVVSNTHDLVGRAATEVYPHDQTNIAIFFDPATGAVLGVAFLVFSARCLGAGDWEYGVLASGYVNSTKQLPPGAPRKVEPVAECTASE